MKRTFYILMVALALGISSSAAPRQHQRANISMTVDSTRVDGSIEAVSDTSSTSEGDDAWADADDEPDDSVARITINGQQFDPAQYSNPISYFGTLWGLGVGGVMLALFIMAVILIILILPVILLILILRYLIKRHNDRVDMEREAYARYSASQGGADISQSGANASQGETNAAPDTENTTTQGTHKREHFISPDRIADEEMWRKGVKTITVGAGLLLASCFWGSWGLAGVAAFILCIGAGKAFIGMTSRRKDAGRKDNTGSAR